MVVAPDGLALPSHSARMLPMKFPNLREQSVAQAWRDSPGFNAYRGEHWMNDICRSCPEHEKDFGGCRCQAFLLTGDAAATDPVCTKSPAHGQVEALVVSAAVPDDGAVPLRFVPGARRAGQLVFRTDENSRTEVARASSA